MKRYFKYEHGYINVDAENLYLTNTGNWSETRDMVEKSGSHTSDGMRRARIIIFFGAVVFGLGMMFIGSVVNFSFSPVNLIILIASPIAAFSLYKYLRHDFGPQYRIPLTKLQSVEIKENTITLHFITKENKPASEALKNVEEKGIEFFTQINQANAPA